MSTLEERIEAKERKLQQEKAKLQKLKAKQNTEKRKQDTRRKIIVGAVVLEHIEHDERFAKYVTSLLNKKVTGMRDRELLDLHTENDNVEQEYIDEQQ
ncbi:MAG: mobilization protein [Actinobacteria bacterium]|nr:mobilization protein [Actinomycetota bacterium]